MKSRSVLIAGIFTLVIAAGCASPPVATNSSQLKPSAGTAVLTSVAPWPTGYGQPSRLVGDPDAGGVWWWSTSESGSALFHHEPDKGTTSFPLDKVAGQLPLTLDFGLTVTSDQVVLGVQREVIALDRATGKLTRWNLDPDAEKSTGNGTSLPAQILGLAAHGPMVVMSVRDDPALEILDETSGQFSTLALPTATKVNDLVFDSGNSLAVSLLTMQTPDAAARASYVANEVLVSKDLKTFTTSSVDAKWITALPNGFLAGGTSVTAIDPDETVHPWGDQSREVPSGVRGSFLSTQKAALAGGGNAVMLVTADASRAWTLPEVDCPSGVAIPPPTSETETNVPPTDCANSVMSLTADGAGNIWAQTALTPGLLSLQLS